MRPRPETYSGPVVVLIDEMSVSAAEFFASGIKDLTDARLDRNAYRRRGSWVARLNDCPRAMDFSLPLPTSFRFAPAKRWKELVSLHTKSLSQIARCCWRERTPPSKQRSSGLNRKTNNLSFIGVTPGRGARSIADGRLRPPQTSTG